MFLGFPGEKVHFYVSRTVLEKVSCFGTPCTAWYKGARFTGDIIYQKQYHLSRTISSIKNNIIYQKQYHLSKTHLPFLFHLFFLVQRQNHKLAFRKLTKRQVEAIQTCLPLLLYTPQSGLLQVFLCKRATNHGKFRRKMTYEDKGS